MAFERGSARSSATRLVMGVIRSIPIDGDLYGLAAGSRVRRAISVRRRRRRLGTWLGMAAGPESMPGGASQHSPLPIARSQGHPRPNRQQASADSIGGSWLSARSSHTSVVCAHRPRNRRTNLPRSQVGVHHATGLGRHSFDQAAPWEAARIHEYDGPRRPASAWTKPQRGAAAGHAFGGSSRKHPVRIISERGRRSDSGR